MKKLIAIITIFFPLFASAENLDLKYEASWSGINAGTAEVIINETGNSYTDRVRADATGMVKDLTNYWAEATTSGTIVAGVYKPNVYDVRWQPKKAPQQQMVLNYDKNGVFTVAANPPEIRKKHPDIADKDKQGLPDPISAAMMIRKQIRQIVESGHALPQSFTVRIFDSHRITDLNLNIIGYQELKLNNISQKLLKIAFTRVPVAGYSDKELALFKTMSPTIDIYANSDYVPVYAVGQAIIGRVEIKLVSK